MPRVLICDKLEAAGLDILQSAGIELDNRPGLKGTDLATALRAAAQSDARGTNPDAIENGRAPSKGLPSRRSHH